MTQELSTSYKETVDAWLRIRAGKVTASRFADILTSPRDKSARWSATANAYRNELLAEIATRAPRPAVVAASLAWGMQWELQALETCATLLARQFDMPTTIMRYEFIEHPEFPQIGGSPDALMGDDYVIEAKCPYDPAISIATRLDPDYVEKHRHQIQGLLWITGRSKYVFTSYDPRFVDSGLEPLYYMAADRDPEWEREFAPVIVEFRDYVNQTWSSLVSLF